MTTNEMFAAELPTVTPALSTTVARSIAASWPSRTSAVPVPVFAEGASRLSMILVGLPAFMRVPLAVTDPSADRQTVV